MGIINPAHVEQIIEITNKTPLLEMLDMRIVELRDGYCKATVLLDNRHLNLLGVAHGGIYAIMIDTVTFFSQYCTLPADVGSTTLDLVVNDLRGAVGGLLTFEGHVIKHGSSVSLTEAEAYDEKGKLLAQGQSKIYISDRLPPLAQAFESKGYGPIPPKFLD